MSAKNYFGILNLIKPKGMTSRQAVSKIHQITRPSKAGHAGTLDPLATGVLVVCLGQATRLIDHVQHSQKTYRGKFILGKRSDTDDITGNVEEVTSSISCSQNDVETILKKFEGEIEQVPPRFSAVHIDGKRAYKLARQNKQFEIKPKKVRIDSIQITNFSLPEIELEIQCGSGTYIRSIGRDLGNELGCGAVMTELVRTRIGPFQLSDAIDPNSVTENNIDSCLQPALLAVDHFREYQCHSKDMKLLKNGCTVPCEGEAQYQDRETVRLMKSETDLIALARYSEEENLFKPYQVFTSQLELDA
jgi:tRNA pseudouridine55 synthase